MSISISEKRNILFRCCCTGGNHTKEFNSATKEPDNFCMAFFRDKMASLVKYTMAKIIIAALFAIYLIVAGWLYSRVKGGLDYSSLFPTGSYGSRFVKLFYRYFADYPQRLQIIADRTMDYTQPEVQKKINDIVKRFEETQYTNNTAMTESWLKYFNMFTETFFGSFMLMSHNLSKKSDFFDALTKYYLQYEYAAVFVPDIKFNENRSDIIATRYLVQVINMNSCQREMEMVQHVRNIADSFEFPVHIHDIWFTVYDIFLGVRSTFIQFCLTSLSVTVVLFFVFAPSIPCALCVLISFFSIQLGTISYVSLWNVDFNIISAFSQMGCTIIPVIYLIQLPYAYHRSDGKRRIQQAFFFAGMPIFQNTLAITACVFILTFAPIPILTIFFRVFCVMMFLSVLHVFFVIPTILSVYESLFPQATIRKKRSLHRTSIRSSLKRSSIVSSLKASIRTNKGEPDEDTKPMSVDDENEEDSDVESGQLHTFSELNNNVFEFEDPNASDSNSS